MDQEQRSLYMNALATAIALARGPRDQDYNGGGVGLRDYWEMNGIRSPLQMVDMKLKRARSLVAGWNENLKSGRLMPKDKADVAKLTESMVDLINYAAFVVCEAASLLQDGTEGTETAHFEHDDLAEKLDEAVEAWHKHKTCAEDGEPCGGCGG